MQQFKQGDSKRKITDTLELDSVPVDLSGCTVRWFARHLGNGEVFGGAATVTNATEGKVEYQMTSEDVRLPGMYAGEWRVTFADGKELSLPAAEYTMIEILPNVR